MKKHDDC